MSAALNNSRHQTTNLNSEDVEEVRALIVGFLQQSLKESRSGLTIQEFDRQFPSVCDEEPDWYRRFGKTCSLDVLRMVPETANISTRGNQTFVSLNLSSEAVDEHLVNLITNQKSKKRNLSGQVHV